MDVAIVGKAKRIVGVGIHFTDVEKVMHTHVCVDRAITPEGSVLGKMARYSYVITNTKSIKSWISKGNEN